LIDSALSNATGAGTAKSGYFFAMGVTANAGVNVRYVVGTSPAAYNVTGIALLFVFFPILFHPRWLFPVTLAAFGFLVWLLLRGKEA